MTNCSPPRLWPFPYMRGEHIVYVCRRGGRILYVGLTSGLPERLTQHRRSPWGALADNVEFHGHLTRDLAAECERRTIHALQPEFQGSRDLALAKAAAAHKDLPTLPWPEQTLLIEVRRLIAGERITDHAAVHLEVLFKALRAWGWPAL